jgi:Fic family protein
MIEPSELHLPASLAALLAQIDEFKGRWKALTWLSPEVLQRLRRTATIESVGSSTRIEGSQLSNQQVEALLARLETTSFRSRDEEEVAGYARAMEMVFDAADILPLTENHLLQLHATLLQHSTKDERHRGGYKTLPNHVAAFDADGRELGIVFQTTSPFDTPQEMQALTAWLMLRERQRDLHPLLVIGIYGVVFLKIHPFQDGNGRLSRILTTLLLLRAGYAYVPYASLEAIVEQNKEGYYRALRATQTTLNGPTAHWLPWLEYFLLLLVKQTQALGAKVDALQSSMSQLGAAERRLLEHVAGTGRITVAEAVALTQENRNTLRKRLAGLVAKGFLMLEGKGRSAAYRKR